MHEAVAEHRFLAPGFGSALLSLVAGRISRADGSTTLGLGRSRNLRQPNMERFWRPNAPRGIRAAGSKTANRPLRSELDTARQSPFCARAVLRSPGVAPSFCDHRWRPC